MEYSPDFTYISNRQTNDFADSFLNQSKQTVPGAHAADEFLTPMKENRMVFTLKDSLRHVENKIDSAGQALALKERNMQDVSKEAVMWKQEARFWQSMAQSKELEVQALRVELATANSKIHELSQQQSEISIANTKILELEADLTRLNSVNTSIRTSRAATPTPQSTDRLDRLEQCMAQLTQVVDKSTTQHKTNKAIVDKMERCNRISEKLSRIGTKIAGGLRTPV